MAKNNARMIDANLLIAAGIDPKTFRPIRGAECTPLQGNVRQALRVLDEQDAITVFKWYNLPEGVTGELIERILYYRGRAALFYHKTLERFYFLPFALDGSIDIYGRFKGIKPLPFYGGTTEEEKRGRKIENPFDDLTLYPQYEVQLDEQEEEDLYKKCVILNDYCQQVSQTVLPRQAMQEGIIQFESELIPYMRTALKNATGIKSMRVNSADEASNVTVANKSFDVAALEGNNFVAVEGAIEFQELTGGQVAKAEEYLLAMESVDNFRLSFHGIDNGGLFQKKAHMLQSEQELNAVKSSSALRDKKNQRQTFCDIVNSIWGLGIWCEPENGLENDEALIEEEGDTQNEEEVEDDMQQ